MIHEDLVLRDELQIALNLLVEIRELSVGLVEDVQVQILGLFFHCLLRNELVEEVSFEGQSGKEDSLFGEIGVIFRLHEILPADHVSEFVVVHVVVVLQKSAFNLSFFV